MKFISAVITKFFYFICLPTHHLIGGRLIEVTTMGELWSGLAIGGRLIEV